MSRQLSIEKVLAELKARIERHRSQEAFHAEQEVFHQKEKVRHAEELQLVVTRFEAFQAAADAVTGLVEPPQDQKEDPKIDDSIPHGKGAVLSKLVARLVATKSPTEPFGASEITHEIQQRYGARLKRKVDVRAVAAKLRRMAGSQLIHQTREGRAFHEALYSRTPSTVA